MIHLDQITGGMIEMEASPMLPIRAGIRVLCFKGPIHLPS
jgi:hypothetical protein